ncbi:endonuclease/exonuclease/phosphatase family protein [Maioricimonas sp. JC845]|uniref:endonuclease/exonuclease/phosphatase family protein n=1 Tax=Maioricimonas sp. JC845 TaxID=3232138 RepID=UPI00345ABB03
MEKLVDFRESATGTNVVRPPVSPGIDRSASTMTAPPLSRSQPGSPQATEQTPRMRRRSLLSHIVTALTVVNALGVAALLLLISVVSEEWWLTAVLTYLPRLPWAVPSLLLLVVSLFANRTMAWVNGIAAILVLGPVMGLSAPVGTVPPAPDDAHILRIATCNVQGGIGHLPKVLHELDLLDIDLLVAQEAVRDISELESHYADWHQLHIGEFWFGSRYPIRHLQTFRSEGFDRETAVAVEVDGPDGPFRVVNIHLSTARHGLMKLAWHSPFTDEGVKDFEWYQWQREVEALDTAGFAVDQTVIAPTLVLGDFNTPTTSSMFVKFWSRFTSAFESAGLGYGYTSPCNTGTHWPRNTPWLRIDHVLHDGRWDVHDCRIGRTDGSDHRLVMATVSLRPERNADVE